MSTRDTSVRRFHLTRKRAALTAGISIGALLMTGCVQSEREEGAGAEGSGEAVNSTFVFAASSDPKSLDPAFASDGESFRVSRQIFEGLVGVEKGTADPAPLLAESWETSEDGLATTFKLKEGVKFHDGTDFNAEAVCFNFERWYNWTGLQQAETVSYYYNSLFRGFKDQPDEAVYESCEANGDNEVTVNLAKPFAGFVPALSLPAFAMQSPTALEEFKADEIGGSEESPKLSEYALGNPVGTGPFKFESWDVGQQLELSSFEDYWGEKGQITETIFRIIDDPQARRQALEAGTIDGYDLVAPADVQSLKDGGYNVVARDPFTILYLGFNHKVEQLADPLVREAIAHAIDKEALVSQTLPEGTKVATQFIPDVVDGYNEDVTTYDFDPEKAKELLAEAGYPDGFEVQFNYPTNVSRPYMPTPEQVFTNLQAQLADVGITVTPAPAAWSPDYLDQVQGTEDHGLHLLGWTGDYNDTDNFIGVFFGQQKPEFGFDNPELFAALDEARGMTDRDEQTKAYEEINEQIAEFIPAIPLAHPAPSLAFNERVTSYPASPVNDEVFSEIELSK
ncbi:ABC transporter substrate-binding protein [Arthrobacter sp. MSA 4-2]|uniref:ABC transporter substrate-binding protein n=1 Tax=Arthrobacter sp. MSA 4-2 TaxID=2794349 RepID=UPI0018E8357E|nr:ABC transporter substrate-binding protein [Arthrobacter sp. MSA 4-2]MBJ2120200.1 ABC transporter substrate-binding protein [Arthrobacter sp. MSA 4-2]